MKHLRKKLRKRTVEAYTCYSCATTDQCVIECVGNMDTLFTQAREYGKRSESKV